MDVLLFAGFLGSGKTTLILSLARRAAASGSRICVIVNEIGEVGIDGEALRMGDLEVRELTAGCICCQIGPDLVRTLRNLEERYQPGLVIIEASGVATPGGVLEALHHYPVKSVTGIQTVTVVDSTRFVALREVLTPLIEAQIRGADLIVVTKVDEATGAEVEAAKKAVELLAPGIPVFAVDATDDATLAVLAAGLIPEEVRA
ncbi:MAG: cobalamin biosynthesis protein P47K [Actinomycetia bacterium]|nr:cobalamin biosynthesis protein P47K [Actinomycetes bacterium]